MKYSSIFFILGLFVISTNSKPIDSENDIVSDDDKSEEKDVKITKFHATTNIQLRYVIYSQDLYFNDLICCYAKY